MSRNLLSLLALLLLAGCAWRPGSNWYLMDSGYSVELAETGEFAMEVHLNQMKQLGGDLHSAEFRRFVGERLKWERLCPSGWAFLPCTDDGSCVQRTRRSVTVYGRCEAP
jgi:hypothetical protein